MWSLAGDVLITGWRSSRVGRGIGRAVAKGLAAEGALVIANNRSDIAVPSSRK